tara:strand:- start:908 stop:1714 length:807 start_codon:yes stop_codon:yes gene_type:complete
MSKIYYINYKNKSLKGGSLPGPFDINHCTKKSKDQIPTDKYKFFLGQKNGDTITIKNEIDNIEEYLKSNVTSIYDCLNNNDIDRIFKYYNFNTDNKITYSYGGKLSNRFDYLQKKIKAGKTIVFPTMGDKDQDLIDVSKSPYNKKYVTNLGLGIGIRGSIGSSINKQLFDNKVFLLDEINLYAKLLSEIYRFNVRFGPIPQLKDVKENEIYVWGANESNKDFHEKGETSGVPEGGGQAAYIREKLINKGVNKEQFYGIDTMSDYTMSN